jgi:hypothetical protein
MAWVVIDDERLTDQLDIELASVFGPLAVDAVVAHSRSETLMVFGSIAPGRVGAPIDGPSFRVVSGYSDGDLDGLDVNRADILQFSLDRLLFSRANVVAVSDQPEAGAPAVTIFRVADPLLVEDVQRVYGDLFGESEVVIAGFEIEGIDIEVELGQSYVEFVRGDLADVLAGSGGDANDDSENVDG